MMRRWGNFAGALVCCVFLLTPAGASPSRPAYRGAPPPPAVASREPVRPPSMLLMELSTGRVLESSDPHRRWPPASLSKLMTLYLTLQAVRAGRLTLETEVTVSAQAWRIGRTPDSSRMFLNVGDVVSVSRLLEGMMIASGNDAAEALAEIVAGSSEQFVADMNAAAARLGMRDTHFVTPHGLPVPEEYTSAWDMALLSRQILLDDPGIVRYSSPRYATYAGIRQANWNNLVFRDSRVDGLKTGHTAEAGFGIVATARQGTMRLIAVVMGAPTLQRRTALAERLLNAGFAGYAVVSVPWQQIVPGELAVYGGTTGRLPLEAAHPVQVLLARASRPVLTVSEEIQVRPVAPIRRGQRVGRLTVYSGETLVANVPLASAATVARGGIFTRVWGTLAYAVGALTHRTRTTWTGTYTPPG